MYRPLQSPLLQRSYHAAAALFTAGMMMSSTIAPEAAQALAAQPGSARNLVAATVDVQQSGSSDRSSYSERLAQSEAQQLPRRVRNRVRRFAAREIGVPPVNLQVVSATQQDWSDSCLGLGGPAELCAAVMVPGWRVEITDGESTLVYRTDSTGQTIRQETRTSGATLPQEVSDRVLAAASEASGIPVADLTIVDSQERVWNGCLGINQGPDTACTMIAIYGWQVVVNGDDYSWVYHTNHDGSDVRLNDDASLNETTTVFVPTTLNQDFFLPLDQGVVFRTVNHSGFAGIMTETVLLEDGTVMRSELGSEQSTRAMIAQLSPEEVEAFQQSLYEQRISNYSGLSYMIPTAADYPTTVYISNAGAAQVADIEQEQLPESLQTAIQTWNQLIGE